MNIGWLLILASFLIFLHHFSKHGYWYDAADLRALKWRSHEFWSVLSASIGMFILAI